MTGNSFFANQISLDGGVDTIGCTNPSQRAINGVAASFVHDACMYERRAADTHRHILGADTSALQKRDDHANSIFAPWWNDHGEEEGTASLCAYLTQMLKLSYALQYHRKLRRIDRRARKRVSGAKALRIYIYIYPRTRESYIRCNLYFGKEPQRGKWEKRGEGEMKRKLRSKLEL